MAPSLLVKQGLHGVCRAEGGISVVSLSLLSVLSAPSPSPYQARATILAAGVSHRYELVPSIRGGVGGRGLASLHIFPEPVLPPWSQWSQTCNIM